MPCAEFFNFGKARYNYATTTTNGPKTALYVHMKVGRRAESADVRNRVWEVISKTVISIRPTEGESHSKAAKQNVPDYTQDREPKLYQNKTKCLSHN